MKPSRVSKRAKPDNEAIAIPSTSVTTAQCFCDREINSRQKIAARKKNISVSHREERFRLLARKRYVKNRSSKFQGTRGEDLIVSGLHRLPEGCIFHCRRPDIENANIKNFEAPRSRPSPAR
jgi:hypothetical protein